MSPTPNEFSRIDFSRGPAPRDASELEASSFGPYQGTELVPTPGDPKLQFSSDKADTPEAMANETADSQSAFAELQNFLMGNLETPGSRVVNDSRKPWTPPHGEGD